VQTEYFVDAASGPGEPSFRIALGGPPRRRCLMMRIARLLSLHLEAGQYRTAGEPFVVVATTLRNGSAAIAG
jgi:hypothetical protein